MSPALGKWISRYREINVGINVTCSSEMTFICSWEVHVIYSWELNATCSREMNNIDNWDMNITKETNAIFF